MKKYIGYVLLLGWIIGFSSCRMELDPYDEPTNRVAFVFETKADTVIRYTFAYFPEEVKTDTVWVEVTAMGYLCDWDRKVTVVPNCVEGVDNAETGIHFIPVSELSSWYVIPANATGVKLPVVVKRDPSLKEKEYTLELMLTENNDFSLGAPNNNLKRILISDILMKPNTWKYAADHYLKTYGTEKHRVMIEAAAPYGMTINDEWIESVINKGDYGYIVYWLNIFKTKLQEINARRAAEGKGVLTEGPEYGNTTVSFD